MTEAQRELVRIRASHRCEYCHLPQAVHDERFSVDHVTATKHRGPDSVDNLAFSCLRCNLYKGTDLTSVDPETKQVVSLFHPRRQQWSEHFRFDGPIITGITPTGRVTVLLLRMNAPERVWLRTALIREGRIPPG